MTLVSKGQGKLTLESQNTPCPTASSLQPPQEKQRPPLPLSPPSPARLIHQEIIHPDSPTQRPGSQKGGKKKGFSSLVVMAFAPAAREALGKGESFISALSLYHTIKYRTHSAKPGTGLGIHNSTNPCTQGTHGHDSKASRQKFKITLAADAKN